MKTTRRIKEDSTPKGIHFRPVKCTVKKHKKGFFISYHNAIDYTKIVVSMTESEAEYLARQLMGIVEGGKVIENAKFAPFEVLFESKMNFDKD